MLGGYFRWLYHRRQRRAAKQRLSGKARPTPRWSRFSYQVFHKATVGKYDLRDIPTRTFAWVLGLPACAILLWFLWNSYRAWGIFQP